MQVSQNTNHELISVPKKENESFVNNQEVKLEEQKSEVSTAQNEQKNISIEEKDELRKVAVGYLAHQSKKSQIEIYLSVATGEDSSNQNSTAQAVSSLRDVQKQNDAVEAYATYKEEQKNSQPTLF